MIFNTVEEIKQVQQLLRVEQEEDRTQYRENVLKSSLTEKRKKGLCWYPVIITEESAGLGSRMILVLERTSNLDEPHKFQFGKVVSLFTNNSAYGKDNPFISGVISSVRYNKVKVIFNADELPEWVDEGKLGLDLLFDEISYKEMENALKRVMQAEKTRLAELREVLLGNKAAEFEVETLVTGLKYPNLNEFQNEAVKNIARAKDLAIVHGPPGTGKTTTIIQSIIHTLKTEKQVLVCAPSNTAIDLLTDKLASKGVNVVRLGNPARISESLLAHTLDGRMGEHKDFKEIKKLRKGADEYRRLASKYKRHFGKEEREQRKLIVGEAKKMEMEAGQLEFYITEDILNSAQVITCTLVGAAHNILRDRQFRTVFIDEAAQALEPATWIPILRAQRVVFAGDHCQLPPTVKSQKAAKDGLSITLFEKAIARQNADVMLRTQYRMHKDIMDFSSRQFYESALEAHESVIGHVLLEGHHALGAPLEFLDTAGCGFEEKFDKESMSLSNPEEAGLLFKHLTQLMAHISDEAPELLQPEFRIGIISPYKAQVNYIKDNLAIHPDLAPFLPYITVNTVDGFQGQERDIMYISMARSNDSGEIGFLSDTRRMNVALTRARKKLVVIGDSATLASHPFYRHFLDYVDEVNAYRSAWEFAGI